MTTELGKTHLDFYEQHQIAPVRYNINDMEAHLQRRGSLYLKLGLHPLAFRNAKVLEVAAGTGQNSLYPASLLPAKLVLVEPNMVGRNYIHQVYSHFTKEHTKPELITSKLEDFEPTEKFDIVLCENWLGTSLNEINLLQKLKNMLAKNGVLVVTTVSPIGFIPNLIRRFCSLQVVSFEDDFQEKTHKLVQVFGPHLDTLGAMTRNKEDWVQDNMLNPAYYNLCLTIPSLIDQLGDSLDIVGSSPQFNEDWRWFKGLHGELRQLNSHSLDQYWQKAHNFLDYREEPFARDPKKNIKLERSAIELLQSIRQYEVAWMSSGNSTHDSTFVLQALQSFISHIPNSHQKAIEGLTEVERSLRKNGQVALDTLNYFKGLFGRETTYVAFTLRDG